MRRAYDHRLREHVPRTGARSLARHLPNPRSTLSTVCSRKSMSPLDSIERLRTMVEFYAEQHNTQMPHAAFSRQTPDKMYFGTAANLQAELEVARSHARTARPATAASVRKPAFVKSRLRPDCRGDAVAYAEMWNVRVRSSANRGRKPAASRARVSGRAGRTGFSKPKCPLRMSYAHASSDSGRAHEGGDTLGIKRCT
jgi:hypothetical protein